MKAYLIDVRGVFLEEIEVDPMGAQPPGAVYVAPPGVKVGFTRIWRDGEWSQVPDADVPPLPAPVKPAPTACTRRQGRLALLQYGLLDDVEDAIAAIPDPAERRAAQIEYEADTWERSNAFLQALWESMGGTAETLDDLFRLAVTL